MLVPERSCSRTSENKNQEPDKSVSSSGDASHQSKSISCNGHSSYQDMVNANENCVPKSLIDVSKEENNFTDELLAVPKGIQKGKIVLCCQEVTPLSVTNNKIEKFGNEENNSVQTPLIMEDSNEQMVKCEERIKAIEKQILMNKNNQNIIMNNRNGKRNLHATDDKQHGTISLPTTKERKKIPYPKQMEGKNQQQASGAGVVNGPTKDADATHVFAEVPNENNAGKSRTRSRPEAIDRVPNDKIGSTKGGPQKGFERDPVDRARLDRSGFDNTRADRRCLRSEDIDDVNDSNAAGLDDSAWVVFLLQPAVPQQAWQFQSTHLEVSPATRLTHLC